MARGSKGSESHDAERAPGRAAPVLLGPDPWAPDSRVPIGWFGRGPCRGWTR